MAGASPCGRLGADRGGRDMAAKRPPGDRRASPSRRQVDIGDDAIRVSHRKWEQTQDYDAENFFKFRWGLTLTFDRRMRSLQQASVAILDYAFGKQTTDERRRVVAAVLKPWLAPGVLYKRIWSSLDIPPATPAP